MIHEETVKAFEQEYVKNKIADSPMRGDDFYYYWYPNIPQFLKENVNKNFKLQAGEEILHIMSSSFYIREGFIITDCGIHYIHDKKHREGIIYILWDQIKLVKYTDTGLYFNLLGGDKVHIPYMTYYWSLRKNGCSRLYAHMITNIAKSQGSAEYISDILDTFYALQKEGKEDDALRYALEFRAQDKDNVELSCDIAEIYRRRGQTENAISLLNEDIERIKKNKESIPDYGVLRFSLENTMNMIKHLLRARNILFKDFQEICKLHDSSLHDPLLQEKTFFYFNKLVKSFDEHFLDIPYSKRKLIVPVKEYRGVSWEQETIQVLDLDYANKLEFPPGHPIVNQLYIGHPYIHNNYVLFDGYELKFTTERIREYCYIMQSLGAEEINIETVNSIENKSSIDANRVMDVAGNYGENSGSIKTSSTIGDQFLNSIRQTVQLHQRYKPNSMPKLPTDLVWYDHEPSWQLTYKQRMHGTLLEHEERIETVKSKVVNNSELITLSTDFKILALSVGGKWEQSINKQFESHEDAVLSIKVKFAPLESLIDGEDKYSSSTVGEIQKKESLSIQEYTEAEEKYIDVIKGLLEESFEVSARERRLLNMLRGNLGISEERAAELEALLQRPQLTKEEEEYMDEVKACLEESSEISSGERHLLNKLREQLGISEERVIEIENHCHKSD